MGVPQESISENTDSKNITVNKGQRYGGKPIST